MNKSYGRGSLTCAVLAVRGEFSIGTVTGVASDCVNANFFAVVRSQTLIHVCRGTQRHKLAVTTLSGLSVYTLTVAVLSVLVEFEALWTATLCLLCVVVDLASVLTAAFVTLV